MSTTTQRLSGLLAATVFFVLIALMATFGVRSADAQGPPAQAQYAQGPPVGGCPASYEPGLVTVDFVLDGTGLEEPDPSMDPNGDGYTCLKIMHTGSGTRAAWHDNVIPQ
jgi:hypothetical protein